MRKLIDIKDDSVIKLKRICFVKNIDSKNLLEFLIENYIADWDENKPGKIFEKRPYARRQPKKVA